MFTGIVTDVGTVRAIKPGADTRIEIATDYDVDTIELGASIACSGACLTVIETGDGDGGWFAAEASPETLARTTLGDWRPGTRINLERALVMGDELGGHMVSGHVDGIGEIRAREAAAGPGADGSVRFTIAAPETLSRFIAEKGSVALDGVSLTVNEVDGCLFSVNIIPHTLGSTTLDEWHPGTCVNLEIDQIARYVARLADAG